MPRSSARTASYLPLAPLHVANGEPSEHFAQRMLRLAGDFDRALGLRQRRPEVAALREDGHEPHAAADRWNHRQIEALACAPLDGLGDALVEERKRLAVVADQVVALP